MIAGIKPLTRVVDPTGLNLTSTIAYNARNDVTSVVDEGGRTYGFNYDGSGNPTSINIPISGTATSTSDARGLAATSVDASGNRTVFTRDAVGNVLREESFDAASTLMRRVDTTYDANLNVLTRTLYRTIDNVLTPVTTYFTYDAANRVVAVTDPLGSVRRTEYDARTSSVRRDAWQRRPAVPFARRRSREAGRSTRRGTAARVRTGHQQEPGAGR